MAPRRILDNYPKHYDCLYKTKKGHEDVALMHYPKSGQLVT